MHTTCKVWGQLEYFMFLKEVSYAQQCCIYVINRYSKILKYFYNLQYLFSSLISFKLKFIPVMKS